MLKEVSNISIFVSHSRCDLSRQFRAAVAFHSKETSVVGLSYKTEGSFAFPHADGDTVLPPMPRSTAGESYLVVVRLKTEEATVKSEIDLVGRLTFQPYWHTKQ